MAKLKRTVEKSEYAGLDAAAKAFYVERDGKFYLDADDAEGLTAALETERTKAKQLEARLAGYGDLTPEQVKALNEAKAKAERDKDFAAGNYDKIVAEINAKHAKDLELRDGAEKRLRESLQAALIDAEAVRAITEHGGNPTLLMPIIAARTKLQTVGDKEVAVVIGDKGGPRLKAGAKSAEDFMPIGEYVAELKADKVYAGAFTAGVGSGTGGGRGNGVQRSSATRPTLETKAAELAQQITDGATRVG
jgi:hypothetical protein